jgi:O-antigen/teichoic acid export membrane protein
MIRWLHDKGFFHLLSVNFLTQFLSFGSLLIVAKLLTQEEFGEIRLIQAYAAVFVVLAGFGVNTAILKICSEDRPLEERVGILGGGLKRAAISTAVTLLVVAALTLSGILSASPRLNLWLFVYALGAIPFIVLNDNFSVFLQSLKRIKEMSKAQALIRLQSVILIVLATWLWGLQGFIGATIIAFAAGSLVLLRLIPRKGILIAGSSLPAAFSSIAVFSALANGTMLIGSYADMFILDRFMPDRALIGAYGLATAFLLGATQVTATVQAISTPYFSERAADEHWIKAQLRKTQLRMAALGLLVAAAIFGLAWLLVPLVYGPEYAPTLTFLGILLLKYIIFSSYAVVGVALLGLGLMRYNFAVVAITTPLGLVLAYALLQRYGAVGVAWAQVAVATLGFMLVMSFARLAFRRTYGAPSAGA